MVEFKDRDQIEGWLRNRSREDAIMLAARAALRALPALAGLFDLQNRRSPEPATSVVLPVFRATATSWIVAKYPTPGIVPAPAANAAFAARTVTRTAAADAALAAAFAADAARATVARTAAGAAARTVVAAGRADDTSAFTADAASLELGLTLSVLAERPLWPSRVPGWAEDYWGRLSSALLARREDWEVWTEWYDARLNGRKVWRKTVELWRISLDESVWEGGPSVVNAEIRRFIEAERRKRLMTLPISRVPVEGTGLGQRPSSYIFAWPGRQVEAVAVTEPPFDPVLAGAITEALREKAVELLSALAGNHGDEVVSRDVRRALDLLNVPVTEIAEGILLMRANTVAAHARAYADPASVRERSIRAALNDFSASLDNLVDCYPGLRRIAANRLELEVQAADAGRIATELDAVLDIARQNPAVAPSAVAALDGGRDEAIGLGEKIDRSAGATRASYIEARGKVVAARLLDATNFVSAAAKKAGSEVANLSGDTWREVRKTLPKAIASSLVNVVEGAIEVGGLALLHHLHVPWEIIASMVPRLAYHARKVKEIADSSDDPPSGEAAELEGKAKPSKAR